MKKTLCRIAVVSLGVMSAIAVAAAPAVATPSGAGWSGSWEYSSATALTASMSIPGASLTATGTDNVSSRTFSLTLSDTSSGDGRCAAVTWQDGSLVTSQSTCSTPITFTPYGEDEAVHASLCLLSPTTQVKSHCNSLDIPDANGEPYIRTAGWGFSWGYYSSTSPDNPFNWGATLMMGSAWFSFYGMDNLDSAGDRLIEPWLQLFDTSFFICASGQMLDGSPTPLATSCTANQATELPDTTSTGAFGTGAQSCLWSTLVPRGRGIVKDCLTGFVPKPS
jgi:hypothetical protein